MSKIQELLIFTEEDKIAIMKEFDRTPENVIQDIESIKSWLNKQAYLAGDLGMYI